MIRNLILQRAVVLSANRNRQIHKVFSLLILFWIFFLVSLDSNPARPFSLHLLLQAAEYHHPAEVHKAPLDKYQLPQSVCLYLFKILLLKQY